MTMINNNQEGGEINNKTKNIYKLKNIMKNSKNKQRF